MYLLALAVVWLRAGRAYFFGGFRSRIPRKLKPFAAPQRQGLPRLTRVPNSDPDPDPDPDPDADADADADDGFGLEFLIGLMQDFKIREVINRYVL
ncbi:hypothetical protein QR685DRAFT_259728 [Neurospora intermedia]|uniref:Uncharacterized protein n=1 Tax=Neurospora intermedia TaxID=5142 RepID=A0ABR3DEE8_NEUIN